MNFTKPMISIAIAILFFSSTSPAADRCEGAFIAAARTELETLQAVQARIPRGQYRIFRAEVESIATDLFLSKADTYLQLARLASTRQLTPMLNVRVGAAGVTAAGDVFLGANVEFTGVRLGSTLHAERTALLLANEAGETLETLYSTTTPCAGCREWLQKSPIDPNQSRGRRLARIPVIIGGLSRVERDALIRSVEVSQARYTQSRAGALIQLKDGGFVTGSYFEAAGYEFYSPVAVAIAKLQMAGIGHNQISRIYMLSSAAAGRSLIVDHVAQARPILDSLSGDKFDDVQSEIEFRSIVLRPRE